MNRKKPTEAEMDEFWSYVTGRQQERFNLPAGYFGQEKPKTIPPENFTTNQEDQ